MYICRNKLVYYHIIKDFGKIYFSLLKCKNSYTKWSKVDTIRWPILKPLLSWRYFSIAVIPKSTA